MPDSKLGNDSKKKSVKTSKNQKAKTIRGSITKTSKLPKKVEDSSPEKKWKRFEDLVAHIQQTLTPDAIVKANDHIVGRHTGEKRQIDVSIRQNIGQFEILCVIDCKDHKVPVDVKDVESFIGMVDDVGANRGAIVSSKGFTSTAKTRAASAGIDLLTVVDAEAHEWQNYVAIPTIADFQDINSYQYMFSGSGPMVMQSSNFNDMQLYSGNGQLLGKIYNLLIKEWEKGLLPKEPGEYHNIRLGHERTMILTEGVFYEINVTINIKVSEILFFGYIPVEEIKGFANEAKGEIIASTFKPKAISLPEIFANWQEIPSRDDLAVKIVGNITGKLFRVEGRLIPPYLENEEEPGNYVPVKGRQTD